MNQTSTFAPLTRQSLLNYLPFLQCRKLLIVHGRFSYRSCGAADILAPIWREWKTETEEFDDFQKNPHYEDLKKGLELARKFKPEAILAVGGGSVMDMAKLIRFFSAFEGDVAHGPYRQIHALVPLAAIPTTAGTGSESTHFAVVYKNGIKYSVTHDNILPDGVLLDSKLSYSATPYQMACSGLDALCQAMESCWSVQSTTTSRRYALQALKLIYNALPAAVHHQEKQAMDQLVSGSHLAGQAINISFTTAPHAYSYGLTCVAHVPHGLAVACFLPFFFQINAKVSNTVCNDSRGSGHVKSVLQDIASCLGCSVGQAPEHLKQWILDLMKPLSYSFHLSQKEWRQVLESVNLNRLGNNPVHINSDKIPTPDDLVPLVEIEKTYHL